MGEQNHLECLERELAQKETRLNRLRRRKGDLAERRRLSQDTLGLAVTINLLKAGVDIRQVADIDLAI